MECIDCGAADAFGDWDTFEETPLCSACVASRCAERTGRLGRWEPAGMLISNND